MGRLAEARRPAARGMWPAADRRRARSALCAMCYVFVFAHFLSAVPLLSLSSVRGAAAVAHCVG